MRACWLKWVGRDWSISADYIWLNYSGANTHKQQRFHATRKLEWGDGSKHRAFDDVFGDNNRSIDIFNYRDCIGIRNPRRPVRVFEICRCVVNRFWHIAKVDA